MKGSRHGGSETRGHATPGGMEVTPLVGIAEGQAWEVRHGGSDKRELDMGLRVLDFGAQI